MIRLFQLWRDLPLKLPIAGDERLAPPAPPLRRQALAPPLGAPMTQGVQRPFGLWQGVQGDGVPLAFVRNPQIRGFRNSKTPLLHRDTRLDFAPSRHRALSPPRWNRGLQ